jgi:dipeptidyl aminopeptidase/acylaminoacyl peptidase
MWRALAYGLGAVVAAALAIVGRSDWSARKLVLVSKALIPADAIAAARRAVPGLETVAFRTSDGMTLRGWYSAGGRRSVVVLVHGGGGNRLQLFADAQVLARHGYGFLLYDSRAEGESDGDLVSWGDREQLDVVAALDFVSARRETDPARIALIGFSIGGSTVALAAARDVRARAVILYATWTSLEDEIKAKYAKYGPLSWGPALYELRRAGVDVNAVRPIDHIGEIAPRPLLMIAGTADLDTPVPIMERLFQAARNPKELWIEPGADHGGYVTAAPAEYEARVIAFLERAFAQPTPP